MAKPTSKTIDRIIENIQNAWSVYDACFKPQDLPKPFQNVARGSMDRCPLAIELLETIRGQTDQNICTDMVPSIQTCQVKAASLEQVLWSCIQDTDRPIFPQYVSAILSERQEKLEVSMAGLLAAIQSLAGHDQMRLAKEQLQELDKAIAAISKLGSSITEESKEDTEYSFAHYGSGSLNSYSGGNGNQNVNNNTGRMFVGHTQTFSQVHRHFHYGRSYSDSSLLPSEDGNETTELSHMERVLHDAAQQGDFRRTRWLLERGTNVNSVKKSQTPLHRAASNGHDAVVRLLLQHNADIDAHGSRGHTALNQAVTNNRRSVVQLLLNGGADVRAKNNNLGTPLHWAAYKARFEITKVLLEKGADVNAADRRGWTPLIIAASEGNFQIVGLLLKNGADITTRFDLLGVSALHKAAENDHSNTLRYLLKHGADVEEHDAHGATALHIAAWVGGMNAVKELLKSEKSPGWKTADIHAKTSAGESALYIAALRNRCEIARYLLRKGAAVNSRTNNKWTPLHGAVSAGHEEMVQLLLSKGASTDMKNSVKLDPLSLAVENNQPVVAAILVSAIEDAQEKSDKKAREKSSSQAEKEAQGCSTDAHQHSLVPAVPVSAIEDSQEIPDAIAREMSPSTAGEQVQEQSADALEHMENLERIEMSERIEEIQRMEEFERYERLKQSTNDQSSVPHRVIDEVIRPEDTKEVEDFWELMESSILGKAEALHEGSSQDNTAS